MLTILLLLFNGIGEANRNPAAEFSSFYIAGRALPAISFSREVYPLIQTKCNMPECHGPGGKETSVKYINYQSVAEQAKRIKLRITNRSVPMPPRGSNVRLSPQELQLLLQWIKEGAQNN